MTSFPVAKIEQKECKGIVTFFPDSKIPNTLSITTPLTFAINLDNKIMIVKHKSRGWDIIGGHIEDSETIEECLIREAFEEAGITISTGLCIGYLQINLIEKTQKCKYPTMSALPIYMSNIDKIYTKWEKHEIMERKLCSFEEAALRLQDREDNNQLQAICLYIQKKYLKHGKD